MTQQTIYEVRVLYIGTLGTLRQREPFVVYFSNLKKTIENLTAQLGLNGWPLKINYSAVYRSLKAKEKYACDFDVAGHKVFKIIITPKILNPTLITLGIDEMPVIRSQK
ncbi:hypothetical protein [Runella sp.]|jgi:hypothetical protein|uniref:hypothetical protein n=1 Tax=Runella sp. TaxID=1960881 RepID=UPI00260DC9F6|nr:hypothetical protein [Runella sp.]